MPVLSVDVAVVGGGPAGSATAITLARAGRRVLVIDKARFPRDKTCGDGLTAGALRQLEELGLRPETVPSWQTVDDVWLRPPSGRSVLLPLPRGQGAYAAVARRSELDAALLDVARQAGADVRDGHGLQAARPVDGGVELEVEGLGTVSASYAIGADGVWSPLRKAVGADEPGYLGEFHAFRQYFADVGPATRDMWVWFEPDLVPGYAWSFPLPDGKANVGFGIERSSGVPVGRMKDLWPDLLARPHIREVLGEAARPEAPHRAWPIPARVDRVPLSGAGGRTLFVGDAARATDPMTGEGIAQALLTGRRAAEAVVGAGPGRPADAAEIYRRALRRELFADHRLALLLGRALHHRQGVEWSIALVGRSEWTRRHFARWLFEDYPRAVLATPHRWRRGMFVGPGAYRERVAAGDR